MEACIDGDIAAVRKLLDEGRSVHEPTDEGESLLSLACSAGMPLFIYAILLHSFFPRKYLPGVSSLYKEKIFSSVFSLLVN